MEEDKDMAEEQVRAMDREEARDEEEAEEDRADGKTLSQPLYITLKEYFMPRLRRES
jgi:hypothetical protein